MIPILTNWRMVSSLGALHHVTAFAGDPSQNLDFYIHFLGLRLVKRTVNFDDPATYHFYFGDAHGTPGTLVTFFPWPKAPAGRLGTGQAAGASFAVPGNALSCWIERARGAKIDCSRIATRFKDELITLRDPAGLPVELIASEPESDDSAIVRLHSVTLCESDPARTFGFLQKPLGFALVGQEGNRTRCTSGALVVDILALNSAERAKLTSGMVHHVAFRAPDDAQQLEWREKLKNAGRDVTRVIDRQYFRSVYFREPGGVLFEIATDGPGFFVDEPELGSGLRLPPWLEPLRESIERRLPQVIP
jgi:glyoxalase family protein